jgi:ribosome maturation factor RimP
MSAVAERVERAVAPAVSAAGLELEAVEVQPAGRRRLVRVLVDRESGISLDDVADLSRQLSQVLDDSDAMGDQPYTLEVTSPGLDRPLTLPRHWRRNVGRLVTVTPEEGEEFTGRVVSAGEEEAVLSVAADSRSIRYGQVSRAVVQVEFNRDAGE